MKNKRAVLTVTSGPNRGDTVSLDVGSCRLIGRHLSENETIMIDRYGNRLLDSQAAQILENHFSSDKPENSENHMQNFSVNAFERGPDVIFADDSISRAHAMVFLDTNGLGVIDLASTNGTFVNKERIGSVHVISGDTIAIGNSELEVSLR